MKEAATEAAFLRGLKSKRYRVVDATRQLMTFGRHHLVALLLRSAAAWRSGGNTGGRRSDHSRPRCNVFEPLGSFHQPYQLAPLYSIKGMHDVAAIEHNQQTFHRSLRVPAVFPQ